MKQFFLELLSETGSLSMMRFLSLLSVVAAIYIGVAGIYAGVSFDGLSMLCGVFLGSAFGGKVAQRFAEGKETNETNKDS